MKVDYIARKVNLTDSIRSLTEKKLAKVEKYFTDIIDLRLELSQERHLYVADFSVKGKDFSVNATSSNKELTTAIQDAVDKLEMQARKAKARLKGKGRKRQGVEDKAEAVWNLDVLESGSAAAGTPQIVETSTIPIKPMSIEEAVLQLERSDELFFVFRNAGTDRVNVLYRRSDLNLGLITPDVK